MLRGLIELRIFITFQNIFRMATCMKENFHISPIACSFRSEEEKFEDWSREEHKRGSRSPSNRREDYLQPRQGRPLPLSQRDSHQGQDVREKRPQVRHGSSQTWSSSETNDTTGKARRVPIRPQVDERPAEGDTSGVREHIEETGGSRWQTWRAETFEV